MAQMPESAVALPWEGQAYSVKRHGISITNCDSEPVQTPGCIQAHGALLVLKMADFSILQASENAQTWLLQSADALVGQPVAAAIGEKDQARLRTFLNSEPTEQNPLYAFTLAVAGSTLLLDLTVHTLEDVAILEFEPVSSQPADVDYYALVKKSVARLQVTPTLHDFCQAACREIRALTGLDRVMVYRFHEDNHGEVFAEAMEQELLPWLGLHYPAEDIPRPAREIFKQIWIRPVPAIVAEIAELVPLVNPHTNKPLTMTHCALRAPSTMYTEYLQNMGVKAALTMPIRRGDELWGLIACHHYSKTMYLPPKMRAACEFLAQVVSIQHQAAETRELAGYRQKIEAAHHQLVTHAAQRGEPRLLIDDEPNILEGIEAGGAAVYFRGQWSRAGKTPSTSQLDALADWLFAEQQTRSTSNALYATNALSRGYAPAEAFFPVASGLLAVPLSRTHKSFILWFRPEVVETIHWAGNPHTKATVAGPHGPRLTPRHSFSLFLEAVKLQALPWKSVEIDAASRLRVLVMELVISQADRLALLNAELAQSNEELDAFASIVSHDLKEPLRGIHKYAHQLLDDASLRDEQQRKKVETLARLTLRMDSLLNSLLQYSRVGHTELRFDLNNLNGILAEAVEMVDLRRNERPVKLAVPRPLLPAQCDRVLVREIFVNLLSNALKYNDQAQCVIDVGYIGPGESGDRGSPPDQATAETTIYYVRDNGIGIEAKNHQKVFKIFKRLHGQEIYGGGAGAGLAIVQKLVERHHGHIWMHSNIGEGCTFFFNLPCVER